MFQSRPFISDLARRPLSKTTIEALSLADGSLLWSKEFEYGALSDLVASNGVVYHDGFDGQGSVTISGLDMVTGNEIWSASLPDEGFPLPGGIAISDGTLFVGNLPTSGGDQLYAFRNAD